MNSLIKENVGLNKTLFFDIASYKFRLIYSHNQADREEKTRFSQLQL